MALPAPSLYSQFNNLDDVNIVLNALLLMGFNDVFEVSAAAEMVSEATREYISAHEEKLPLISTACPSVAVSYTHLDVYKRQLHKWYEGDGEPEDCLAFLNKYRTAL